jgi:hypothetical protein
MGPRPGMTVPVVVDGDRAIVRFGEWCARRRLTNIWLSPSTPAEPLWRIFGEPRGAIERTRWSDVETFASN